jgi:uncharacterized membrane protein YphA (DoxX/SURF4 family)
MENLVSWGRTVFGAFFFVNGINHFARLNFMSAYAASKGVPIPKIATIITGLMLLVGGTSVTLNVYPVQGAVVLITFLVPVTLIMLRFWGIENKMVVANESAHFLKNLALMAALVMLIGYRLNV